MEAASAGSTRGARVARGLAMASLVLAALAGAGEGLAGLGYRLQWWSAGSGIRIVSGSTVAALLALALGLAALLTGWFAAPRRTMLTACAGVIVAALFAAPPLYMWRQAARVPAIHDISTDTENPPRFAAVLPLRQGAPNGLDYSAEVAQQQKAAYPDIAPLTLAVPPTRALDLAERAARSMGWDIVAVSAPDLRVEATATTLLFGFKDDVAIRITPAAQGSRIDVRSVSRVGRSDVGANAARIRAYLKALHDLAGAA